MQALCAELEYYALKYGSVEPIETIYFGGGTPSLLNLDELQRILQTIYTHYDTSALEEITLELNPEDINLEYLYGLRSLEIERLSIGIQSFFKQDLSFLNRSHTAEQAEAIIPMVRQAGFTNYTIDLIFGIPGQPEEHWTANLEKAIQFGAPHLSTYSLTVEERTPLWKQVQRGIVTPSDDELVADRFLSTLDYLRRHGYDHYEISNYALPGYRSQHNQSYWQHKNYLGFGPSAHSFWRRPLPQPGAYRWANVRNLRSYESLLLQGRRPVDFRETLGFDRLADEYIMLRLRTSDGLNLDHLENNYGIDLLVEKIDELAWLESEGYIYSIRNSVIRLTDHGKLVCDSVTARLLVDNPFESGNV